MRLLQSVRFWLILLFIGTLIALRVSGVADGITLVSLQEKRLLLMEYVQAYYAFSVLLYILFYIGIVVLALPLAALCTVASGFLFGVLPGVVYSNIAATIGGTLFFLFVRYVIGKTVQKRYAHKLVWFNAQMKEHGILYLIGVRFIALIPFAVLNTIIGLTNVSLFNFIWTTSVGILPGAFVYAYAGKQLTLLTSLRDIFSPPILIAFLLLALLAFVPIMIKTFMLPKDAD